MLKQLSEMAASTTCTAALLASDWRSLSHWVRMLADTPSGDVLYAAPQAPTRAMKCHMDACITSACRASIPVHAQHALSPWAPDTLHKLCSPTLIACLASRAMAAPLPMQEGHKRAKCAVQPGQAVAQADIGAHGRPVRVAIQVPNSAVRLPTRAHLLWQTHTLESWPEPKLRHVTTDAWR